MRFTYLLCNNTGSVSEDTDFVVEDNTLFSSIIRLLVFVSGVSGVNIDLLVVRLVGVLRGLCFGGCDVVVVCGRAEVFVLLFISKLVS